MSIENIRKAKFLQLRNYINQTKKSVTVVILAAMVSHQCLSLAKEGGHCTKKEKEAAGKRRAHNKPLVAHEFFKLISPCPHTSVVLNKTLAENSKTWHDPLLPKQWYLRSRTPCVPELVLRHVNRRVLDESEMYAGFAFTTPSRSSCRSVQVSVSDRIPRSVNLSVEERTDPAVETSFPSPVAPHP